MLRQQFYISKDIFNNTTAKTSNLAGFILLFSGYKESDRWYQHFRVTYYNEICTIHISNVGTHIPDYTKPFIYTIAVFLKKLA